MRYKYSELGVMGVVEKRKMNFRIGVGGGGG